ncbi:efflux RND transporter periplasmic adaptor subunit [bacterium]|nr:efflux RND transporter periplasmic adaptor subunit [bacterium]
MADSPAAQSKPRFQPRLLVAFLVLCLAAASIIKWKLDSRGDPEHLVVSGTVEGEDVLVGSKIAGRLASLKVGEGDLVQSGQVLAEFDSPELDMQRQALEAQLAGAKAQEEKLRNGPRGVDLAQAWAAVQTARAQLAELQAGSRGEDIAALKAQWDSAEAQFQLASADLERSRQLYEQDVIPRSQLDSAQTRRDSARLAADAAKQQYEKAQAGPRETQLAIARAQVAQAEAAYAVLSAGSRPEDIAAAQAQVASASAQIGGIDISLQESAVTAPASGVILTVNHQPGDLLTAGQPLFSLLLTDSYYIQVFIPEDKLAWVQPGTRASFEVDAYPGEDFEGVVSYLSTQGEFTPRNLQTKQKRVEQVFRCKVRISNVEQKLRPGMVCDVIFDHPDLKQAGDA